MVDRWRPITNLLEASGEHETSQEHLSRDVLLVSLKRFSIEKKHEQQQHITKSVCRRRKQNDSVECDQVLELWCFVSILVYLDKRASR